MARARCRPYQPGDERGIGALYRNVFDVRMTEAAWRWVYEDLSGGPAIIVVAEDDQGHVVGHYALQPRPFDVGGRRVLAGLALGTMIAPEYRDVTTLVEMAHLAYDLARERDLRFAYAFPNDRAWRARQALLSWRALPRLTELEVALATWRPDNSRTSSVRLLRQGEDLPQIPWLDGPNPQPRIGSRRSIAWLNWRFLDKPEGDYAFFVFEEQGLCQGYLVAKPYLRDGSTQYAHIIDVRIVPGQEGRLLPALLAAARREFEGWRAERVSLWLLPASSLYAAVLESGYLGTGRQTNFGYLPLDSGLDGLLAQQTRWDVMMADSDVF